MVGDSWLTAVSAPDGSNSGAKEANVVSSVQETVYRIEDDAEIIKADRPVAGGVHLGDDSCDAAAVCGMAFHA
jgi:hypothetical protein